MAPAGRLMPAGATAAVPPPFLVYKRRLYVLAKKPPVLDHRQADIDSIFGTGDEGRPRPARPPARVAVSPPSTSRARSGDRMRAAASPAGHHESRPRFVPRDI